MESNKMLIEEFIFQLRKAENTKKAYQRDLEVFNQYLSKVNISMDDLTQQTVQLFISSLENGSVKNTKGTRYSPSSINRIFAAICMYCDYSNQRKCVKEIDINKPSHISKQAPKSIEIEDIEKIRLMVANSKKASSQRDLAIVDMLMLTGIRVGELVNLIKDDIEYSKRDKLYYIHINASKGDRARVIPINKDKFKYISRYIDSRNDESEYVFISNRQSQLTTRSIQLMLKEFDITPHMLRHSFATRLARTGNDLSMVADLCGHSITVAQRYTTPTDKQKAEAIAKAFTLD
ncbi:tyrosine-type recombinase/integrase [Cytobacillus horneckiae]|uniref:Recombinase XerC n=1 Tax=Cytobacillus horneckiae TaxID=549687 RepID=A0A2N0ZFB9_9BACI|nr:tyrosine-type recombinase/integrase [Cytobacillus horneckiae]MEC1155647.1 tyrosine-type recombinase/integrase [Cytobacillus horneckiae]MED2936965.1 tyrosine-type recombinase/integrase [Cytobacillus horneckiae]PKG28198.1 recombinase XerC [Cytobacillus horneckiae]